MKSLMLLISLTATIACTTGNRTVTDTRTSKIDELMQAYDGAAPGAAVLVLRKGEVAFRKGYGLSDLESAQPITPGTNFRLASITKQFTATAIEILEERDLLEYDAPVTTYLPSLPPYAREITIRHMLTHSSGLPNYEDLIPEDAAAQLHDADVLRLIEGTDRPIFEPGKAYQYSNTGYALLALVVEKVSGESFPAFLEQNIFLPLGMHGSVAHVEGRTTVPARAYGYVLDGERWIRRDQSITSAVLGDGGVYSSIEDLAHWDDALTHAGVVSAETLRLTTSPAIDTDEPGVSYGFGWRISEHRGRRMVWHTGETSGFRNVFLRFPDDRLTVIILTNRSEPKPYEAAMKISELYLD